MPIDYSKPGMKKPGAVYEWTSEEQIEFMRCAQDVIYFAEHYFYIVHPVSGRQLIKLHDFQKNMLKNFQANRFNIVLSSRQIGKTTCSAIYLLWFAMFNPDKKVAILANKQNTAAKIVSDLKMAYLEMPNFIKPGIEKFDALGITFDTGSAIFASATSEDAIRGHSIALLFLDEFAFVPENVADSFWASNYPTISCLPKDTILLTKNGFEEIGDFIPHGSSKGDYVPIDGLDVWGKLGLETASHFYVSPKSNTKIIRTRYGLKHESTLDHPIYTLDDNSLKMKRSEEIELGDSVRVDYGMQVFGNKDVINYEDKGKYTNGKSYSLVVPKLDRETGYLIGGYIGEGWMSQNNVFISNSETGFREAYISSDVFSFKTTKCDTQKLSSNQETYRFFKYILGDVSDKKCHEKTIPKSILKASKEVQQGFLAGLIDADGSVLPSGDVVITSTSEALLLQSQMVLLNMGIISNLHKLKIDKKKIIGNYVLPQGKTVKPLKDSYHLVISRCFGKEIKEFGLKLSRKNSKLRTDIEDRYKNKQFKVPLNKLVKQELLKIFKISGLTKKYFRDNGLRLDKVFSAQSSNTNINWLKKFIKISGNSTELLDDILQSKCFFDEVVSIEYNETETYDLTCPETHSFLQNGILGSNTGGSCIIVSTPNGTGGLYYDIWRKSNLPEGHEAKSAFKSFKVNWWEVPGRDDNWKKETIANIGKVRFAAEYGCSFTGSTHTLIDGDALERLIGKEPILIPEDGYYIWKKPEQGRLYMFGVDVAKGSNNDYHVINIFDVTHYGTTGRIEQVAMYRKNDIDLFAFIAKIKMIASHWGKPPIIVENNHLGSVVCTDLFESEYDNLFYDYEKGDYGINANIKTKPIACSYLKQDIEEGRMIINSEILVSELGFFEETRRGVFEARKGNMFHDDTIAASYWVSYCLRSRFFEDFLHYFKDKDHAAVKELTNSNTDELADEDIASSFFGGLGDDDDANMFQNDLSKI